MPFDYDFTDPTVRQAFDESFKEMGYTESFFPEGYDYNDPTVAQAFNESIYEVLEEPEEKEYEEPTTSEEYTSYRDLPSYQSMEVVPEPPKEPKKEYDVLGGVKEIGKLFYDLPTHAMGAVAKALEEANPEEVYDWKDITQEAENERIAQRRKELEAAGTAEKYFVPGIQLKDIQDASASTGFSAVSMGAGLLGAIPGLFTGAAAPVATRAGAMAAGGAAAAAMDRTSFTRNLIQAYRQAQEAEGKEVSKEDVSKLITDSKDLITEHALWEAIPEAAGNLFMMSGVTQIFKNTFGKKMGNGILKNLAKMYGGELATETVTQTGQHNVEIEAGLGEGEKRSFSSLDDMWESLKEVAPSTFILVSVTGGAGAIGGKTYKIVTNQTGKDAEAINPIVQDFNDPNTESNLEESVAAIQATDASDKAKAEAVKMLDQASKKLGVEEGVAATALENEAEEFKARLELGEKAEQGITEPELEEFIKEIEPTEPERAAALKEKIFPQGFPSEVEKVEEVKPPIKKAIEPEAVKPEEVVEPKEVIEPEIIEEVKVEKPAEPEITEKQKAAEAKVVFVAEQKAKKEAEALKKKEVIAKKKEEVKAAKVLEVQKEKEFITTQKEELKKVKAGDKYNLQDVDITIETPIGTERKGVSKEGVDWATKMKHHYGRIDQTVGKDKEQIDVFIGKSPESKKVFVVDQVDPESKAFDEHKVMMGFKTPAAAKNAYMANYQKGWKGFGGVTEMTIDEFKKRADKGAFNKPLTKGIKKAETFEPSPKAKSTVPEIAKAVRSDMREKGYKALTETGRLQVVQSVKELESFVNLSRIPKEHIQFDANQQIQGLNDPETGNSYIVADNVDSKGAWGVVRHEIGAHAGFENLMGSSYKSVMREVDRLAAEDPALKVARQKAEATSRSMKEPLTADELAEETIAYYVQEEGNVTQTLYRRIKAAIKRWAFKLGIKRRLTPQDLSALVESSMRREIKVAEKKAKEGVEAPKLTEKPAEEKPVKFSVNTPTGPQTVSIDPSPNPVETFMAKTLTAAGEKARKKQWMGVSPTTDPLFGSQETFPDRLLKFISNEPVKKISDKFVTKGLDKFHPLKQLGTQPYMQHRMLNNVMSQLSAWLKYGDIKVDKTSGALYTEKAKQGGVIDWLYKMGEDGPKFAQWLAAKRAEFLEGQGRENYLKKPEREAIFAATKPSNDKQFNQYNEELQVYINNILDVATDAGLINKDARGQWAQEFYIPFYRLMEQEKGLFEKGEALTSPKEIKQHISSGIKRLKGGEQQLGNPIENLMSNWAHLLNESMRNIARASAFEQAQLMGLARRVPKKFVKIEDSNTLSFKHKGETVYFQVQDMELYNALSQFETKALTGFIEKLVDVSARPKRLLTWAITKSPGFVLSNAMRDTIAISLTSKNFVPVFDTIRGAYQVWKQTPDYIALAGSGGLFTQGYDAVGSTPKELASSLVKKTKKGERVVTVKSIYDLWNYIVEVSEVSSRVQLYSNLKGKGKTHLEAAFSAKDVMDFQSSGASQLLGTMSRLTPFMNSRIQGMYKLGRAAFTEQDRAMFWLKGTMLTAASLALWGIHKDEEWYKDTPDNEKMLYYHTKIGDNIIRIPKAFEVGTIFSSWPEAFANYMNGTEEGKEVGNAVWFGLTEALSLNPIPQAVKPAAEVFIFNKNMFTGRPIESWGDIGRSQGLRSDPWTPEVLKALGEKTGVSPKKAKHMIESYLAGLGTMTMLGADWIFTNIVDLPDKPAMTVDEYPVLGRYFRGDRVKRTKQATRNWDAFTKLSTVNNDLNFIIKTKGAAEAAKFMKDNKTKMKAYRIANSYKKALDAIKAQRAYIYKHEKMTAEEKTTRNLKLEKKQNKIHREMYERLSKIK